MRDKMLIHIGLCVVAALAVTACNAGKDKLPEYESSQNESDRTGGPAKTNSELIQENSVPSQNDYVMEEAILNRIHLVKDNLPELIPLYATEGLECESLLTVQSVGGDPSVGGIYTTETGLAIWVSDHPNYHYFWIDAGGNELDHAGFDFETRREEIPERDYPGTGIFNPSSAYGGGVRYYENGKLKKTVPLPQCRRADFTPDNARYLYIDPERKSLTLYDLETESAVTALSAEGFGLGEAWVIDLVNVVTPELATVTLLEHNENNASEYRGEENLRTFLLELPTLRILQRLPDSTELTALDNENFLMTKQENKDRRVSRAKIEGGKLTETETDILVHDTTQYFNSSSIILSCAKKTALIRDWESNHETGDNYMLCRAFSTDTMKLLWECRLSGGQTFMTGFYTQAVVTDDAVLYLFGDTLESGGKPLYRVGITR